MVHILIGLPILAFNGHLSTKGVGKNLLLISFNNPPANR